MVRSWVVSCESFAVRLILTILALAGGMIGSIMVAANAGIGQWGYILFLMSSVTSSALLWKDKEQRALLSLNIFYIGVNIFGLTRWMNWI